MLLSVDFIAKSFMLFSLSEVPSFFTKSVYNIKATNWKKILEKCSHLLGTERTGSQFFFCPLF